MHACTLERPFPTTFNRFGMPGRIFLASRAAVLAAVLAGSAGCNIDRGDDFDVGQELSAAELLAIEAAAGKVAGVLYAENTRADSAIADLTRVAARLVRNQGRASRIPVRSSSPVADTMFAVAVQSRDLTTGVLIDFVFLWRGLDPVAMTVSDAVMVEKGSLGTPGQAVFRGVMGNQIRRGVGQMILTEGRYVIACHGIQNTDESTCGAGSALAESLPDASAPSDLYATFGPDRILAFDLAVS